MTELSNARTEPPAQTKAKGPARWKTAAFQTVMSVAIIAIIVSRIELARVKQMLLGARWELLLLAMGLVCVQLAIAAANVGFLLRVHQHVPYRRLFFYYSFAWTLGHVSLGRVGEFSISYYLKRDGIPYSKSLAIVLLDKVLTLAVFIAVSVIGTLWFFGLNNPWLLLFDVGVLSGGAFLLWLLMSAELPVARVIARFPKLESMVRRRYENLATFRATFFEYFGTHRPALLRNIAGTLVKLLVLSVNGSVLFAAIHTTINPFYMMFIITIAAIIALIPITFSGLGVVSATFIYLVSQVGLPAEAAIANEILSLAVHYTVALAIAILGFRLRPQ